MTRLTKRMSNDKVGLVGEHYRRFKRKLYNEFSKKHFRKSYSQLKDYEKIWIEVKVNDYLGK